MNTDNATADIKMLEDMAKEREKLLRELESEIRAEQIEGDNPIWKAVSNLKDLLELQSNVMEYITRDLGLLAKQLQVLQSVVFMNEMKQACAVSSLVEKQLISEADLQSKWQTEVVPELEKSGLIKKKSGIIVPNSKIITN